MDSLETLNEYQHIFKRLNKLNKNIIHIAKQNVDLQEANRKLREMQYTYEMRLAASERILQSISQEREE